MFYYRWLINLWVRSLEFEGNLGKIQGGEGLRCITVLNPFCAARDDAREREAKIHLQFTRIRRDSDAATDV